MKLLIIDGDNTSSLTFQKWWMKNDIFFNNKIVFGDFSTNEMSGWKDFCLDYNFSPYQCSRTKKKQTTDLHMFIYSMEILHKECYNEIFIATNDGDFILLANAWLKEDKLVTFLVSNDPSHFITNNFNYIDIKKKSRKKKKKNTLEI